jgi:hypothetical protein
MLISYKHTIYSLNLKLIFLSVLIINVINPTGKDAEFYSISFWCTTLK